MKIQIKIKQVELTFEGNDTEGYPRIVTSDKWKGDTNKSERLMEVVRELITEAIRAFNETKIEND